MKVRLIIEMDLDDPVQMWDMVDAHVPGATWRAEALDDGRWQEVPAPAPRVLRPRHEGEPTLREVRAATQAARYLAGGLWEPKE